MNRTLSKCPECGWDTTSAPHTLTPSIRRWRRRLIVVAALLPAVAVLTWAAAVSKPTGYSFGSPVPRFIEPAVSLAQVQAIAEGRYPEGMNAGDLSRRLTGATEPNNTQVPGARSVEVGFVPPATARSKSWSVGWPFAWIVVRSDFNFADAVRRADFVPAKTDPAAKPLGMYEAPSDRLNVPPGPRWRWEGMAVRWQRQPEETGGVFTVYQFRVLAMLLTVLLTILCWRVLVTIAGCRRGGDDAGSPRRGGLLLALMVLGMGCMAWLTGESREVAPRATARLKQANYPPEPVYHTREGFGRLAFDCDQVSAMTGDDDQRLAAEVLRAAPMREGDAARLYLAATYDREAALTTESRTLTLSHRFPVVSFGKESYVRRPDFGAIEPMSPRGGLRVSFEVGYLRLAWSREAPAGISYWIAINLEMLALFLAVPTVLTLVIHGACRRVLVRRCARGECPSCRYQVRMTSA